MKAVDYICENKIIVIVRGIFGDQLLELAHALYDAGIRLMEVTFDQRAPEGDDRTVSSIRKLCQEFGDNILVGAGTVLTSEQVRLAAEAGAKYIISPNTDADVIRSTKQLGLVSIPGAMTPSEILYAHKVGADFVKLFPAGYLGLRYLKDILAPINHIKIVAAAGVNEDNLGSMLDLGVVGVGISGPLTATELIETKQYGEITRRAKKLLTIAHQQ